MRFVLFGFAVVIGVVIFIYVVCIYLFVAPAHPEVPPPARRILAPEED